MPVGLREQVLKMADEAVMSGHQGGKKTKDRIWREFWWPGLGADVTRFCRSCDICQRTIAKGRVLNVPLGKMPIIDTPFDGSSSGYSWTDFSSYRERKQVHVNDGGLCNSLS